MLTRPANRIRRTLDALEAREVCTTLVELNMIAGTVPAHVAPTTRLPSSHRMHRADTVLTLRNATTHALHVTVRWDGAATDQTFTLLPGQGRRVWFAEVERFAAHRAATIRVDDGKGEPAVFRETGVLTADGPRGPVGPGPVHTLRLVHGTLTMNSRAV